MRNFMLGLILGSVLTARPREDDARTTAEEFTEWVAK